MGTLIMMPKITRNVLYPSENQTDIGQDNKLICPLIASTSIYTHTGTSTWPYVVDIGSTSARCRSLLFRAVVLGSGSSEQLPRCTL